jgi:plasmid maintenance system antidote protein VapI
VREDVIEGLGLTMTAAAELPDLSRPNLSLLLNEWVDLSPEMALKLEAAFGLVG